MPWSRCTGPAELVCAHAPFLASVIFLASMFFFPGIRELFLTFMNCFLASVNFFWHRCFFCTSGKELRNFYTGAAPVGVVRV